jgi:hypothetical protein
MQLARNERFIERDFWYYRICNNSLNLTIDQVNQILDGMQTNYVDYTFKFYQNGLVEVIDNNSGKRIYPIELEGAAKDFYLRKRIEYIDLNKNELVTV